MYSKLAIQSTSLLIDITADSNKFLELDDQDIFSMTKRLANQVAYFLSFESPFLISNEMVVFSFNLANLLINLLIRYKYDEESRSPEYILNQVNSYLITY